MKLVFTAAPRLLLAALLGTTSLLATSCQKSDVITAQDYSTIDDGIIQKYVADHKITNAQRQTSGLYFVPDSTNASATRAVAGKTVSVLYTGTLANGTVFDASSLHGNAPFDFVLGKGQVIAGWDEGIALMHKGDRARLLIPSALGYGPYGAGSAIPPNTVIFFDVKVLDVK